MNLIHLFAHSGDLYLIILVLILGLSFFIQLVIYLFCYTSVNRQERRKRKGRMPLNEELSSVSVIICAKNEDFNLEDFLPHVLQQDYPNFEVIVVNDGSTDNTEDVLKSFGLQYPKLYTITVPNNTKIISHKKLAITLAVKASKNDILLFTDADCYPSSNQWIKNMVRNFTPQTEFVLGHGAYLKTKGFINSLIVYDNFFIGTQFLSYANMGLPYMGVGRNMAYRKTTFLKRNGFQGILNMISGDDDLIINQSATRKNTRIESSKEAITFSPTKTTFKEWMKQKRRHLTTTPVYSLKSKLIIGIEPLFRGLFYLAFLLILLHQPLSMVLNISVLSLFLIRYLVQIIVLNRRAKRWTTKPFIFMPIIGDILLPLINLYLLIIGAFRKKHQHIYW